MGCERKERGDEEGELLAALEEGRERDVSQTELILPEEEARVCNRRSAKRERQGGQNSWRARHLAPDWLSIILFACRKPARSDSYARVCSCASDADNASLKGSAICASTSFQNSSTLARSA